MVALGGFDWLRCANATLALAVGHVSGQCAPHLRGDSMRLFTPKIPERSSSFHFNCTPRQRRRSVCEKVCVCFVCVCEKESMCSVCVHERLFVRACERLQAD